MVSVRIDRYTLEHIMTEHDKVEHTLPNGDILVVDSTRVDHEVQQAFAKVREDLRREARDAYRQLREAAAA